MLYRYRAMGVAGHLVRGRLDAANPADLEVRLRRLGLDYIHGNPVRQGASSGSVRRRDLINFCFHLNQLTRAGVPILESLADLRDSGESPRLRGVVAALVESVEGGKTLSAALAEHPGVFDPVFVALIRAGEDSGRLTEVLEKLLESLKWQDELAAHRRRLLLYPSLLLVVVCSVVLFLMLYLVPRLADFIRDMGQQLPSHTRLLLFVSDTLVKHWPLILGLPAALAAAAVIIARRSAAARLLIDDLKLRLPVVGEILRKIVLSRFAAVFAIMYASGIPIIEALRATENVVGNRRIKGALEQAGEMIAQGQQVAAAFQHVGLFPPLVIRMLRVGESTGALDTALQNVGYFYNRDVREAVDRAQALIEPVMTLSVGLLLGWIMVSVLGPIYDLIANLKL